MDQAGNAGLGQVLLHQGGTKGGGDERNLRFVFVAAADKRLTFLPICDMMQLPTSGFTSQAKSFMSALPTHR